MPVTTIGKFKDEPERPAAPQYETLADVPEFVVVKEARDNGDLSGFWGWRDDSGGVILFIPGDDKPFVCNLPSDRIRVHSVLGRITAIQFDTDA